MCEKNIEYSVLKQACIARDMEINRSFDMLKDYDVILSKKYKRKMNRINREIIGDEKIFYPEVDTGFERLRSKIIYWWNKHKK